MKKRLALTGSIIALVMTGALAESPHQRTALRGGPVALISQWNYVVQGSLAKGDSDTRSTVATYTSSSATVLSAAINVARFNYTASGTPQGWWVESAFTNVAYPSEASIILSGAASVSNTTTSPRGDTTAFSITANVGAGSHFYYSGVGGFASGNVFTDYYYVKYNNNTWLWVFSPNQSVSYFNVQTGVWGNIASGVTAATPISLPNGWWLIAVTQTLSSTNSYAGIGVASANGTNSFVALGTESFYAWGTSQIQNSYQKSYIKTTSAFGTMAGDTAANPNWWNGTSGNYLMVESTSEATGTTSRATYCASGCTSSSAFAPADVWITQICQFKPTAAGAADANTNKSNSAGTPCS